VVYYGKPHRPIYDAALAAAGNVKKPLAIGDGMFTDILGANRAGLDVLFIADGVHGEDVEPYNADHLEKLLAKSGVHALAASRSLTW
jgi:ribonucleotide monophosphatase NagD (HAD superfamily)